MPFLDTKDDLGAAAGQIFDRRGHDAPVEGTVLPTSKMLAARGKRFIGSMDMPTADALFVAPESRVRPKNARSYLVRGVLAETGAPHEAAFAKWYGGMVATDPGHTEPVVAEQMSVPAEEAMHAAVYRRVETISAAGAAASVPVEAVR